MPKTLHSIDVSVALVDVIPCKKYPCAGVGMQRFSCQYPVLDANGSCAHVGHCRVAFRSLLPLEGPLQAMLEQEKSRSDPATVALGSLVSNTYSSPAAAELASCSLATKVSGDPARWPADHANHIIVSIQNIQLRGAWADSAWNSFQVFWNLLDNVVDTKAEATRCVPAAGVALSVGDTTLYSLAGSSEAKHNARVCLDP